MAGEIEGTDIGVAVETTPGGGIYANIGGISTSSFAFNHAIIDITNKSTAGWRSILPEAGLKTVDVSLECLFSSDANFDIMKAAFNTGALLNYQIARGGELITGAYKIASWSESYPDNDKVTVSVTLNSSDEVTIV